MRRGDKLPQIENQIPNKKFKVKSVKSKKDFLNNLKNDSLIGDTINSFKINLSLTNEDIKFEAINNAIHEYLLKMNLNKTLDTF